MSALSSPSAVRFDGSWIASLGWLAVAAAAGAAAAQLPLLVSAALLAGVALLGAAVVTPVALLAALLILAPLRTLMLTEAGNFGLPLDIGQWLVFALIGAWGLHTLARRRGRFNLRSGIPLSMFIPLGLFIAATALSAFTAYSLSAWLTEWLKWVQVLIIALLTIDLARETGRETIVFLLVAAGLANAVIGIYQYFGGSGALHLVVNERFFRAFGTFGQPNPFGGFMGLMLPFALAGALTALFRLWHLFRRGMLSSGRALGPLAALVFYGGAGALMAAALVMSWSRGAWLGFGVSLAVMLFALPRRLWQSLLLAGAAVLLVGGLAVSGRLPASITARLATVTEDVFNVQDVRGVDITPANYAVIERLAHWQAAINMATQHPWLGVGFGGYEVAYPDFRLINWKFALGHAHNYYLNVLAETGIIGLFAYAFLILSTLAFSWNARRHPDTGARLSAIAVLGAWTYLTVHSLTDNLYVNNLFLHIGVTIGVIVLIAHDLPSRGPHQEQATVWPP